MKKIIAILLSFAMLVSLAACGGRPASAGPSPSPAALQTGPAEGDPELDRAAALGLIIGETQNNSEQAVTHAQFCAMLSLVIEKLYGAEYLAKWQEVAKLALAADMPMDRGDGAMAIFEAALAVGMDDYHSNGGAQPDIDSTTDGDGIFGMREREDYPLFPNWREPYYNINWEEQYETLVGGAVRYCWHRKSAVSGKTILEYDENLSMRYNDPFTPDDAVRAALRLYEAWVPRSYAAPNDPQALMYDRSIITEELLQKPSNLPQPTKQQLPASWRGLCIYSKGVTHYNIAEAFRERDMRFLSENGFNFARVFLGFTTLGYPDHPENGAVVNLAELEDLDRCIAWGLQYDVHISLCMLTPPGFATQKDVEQQGTKDDGYPTQDQWKLTQEYWMMLAMRYADIPSKNLSFELCAEWHLDNRAADFKSDWEPIVGAISAISPERVLLASFDTAIPMKLKLAEDMASMGVALAAHPYNPWQITRGNEQVRVQLGFTGELSWPLPWFPSGDFNNRTAPVIIEGAVGGTTLSVCVFNEGMAWEDTSGKPSITIYADGTAVGTRTFTTGGAEDALTVNLPNDTQEITLKHTSGYLELASVRLDGPFGSAQIMPHDLGWSCESAGPAHLLLATDGTWSSADGRFYDGEEFYKEELLPYITLAKQYDVGFMVNEFVFADDEQDTTTPIPLEALLNYYGDAIQIFKAHEIGCVLDFVAHGSTGIIWDSPGFGMWGEYPNYQPEQIYTFLNGRTERFFVNKTLLDRIKLSLGMG